MSLSKLALRSPETGHSFDYDAFMGVTGSVYVSIASLYTILLFIFVWFFFKARNTTPVKLRGFGLTLAMVLTIHIYLVALFVVYPLNGAFHCWIEYLIMNTLLPFGFALFTCYHLRFVFRAQREIAIAGYPTEKTGLNNWPKLARHATGAAKPWYCLIGGIWLTFLVIGGCLYGFSYRFHESYGTFGTWQGELECRRGPEWITSIGQQFFWAWIIGPIILYRARDIHDSHYWALQTKLCVFAAMLGSPMWLIFLYVQTPATAALNYYFPPAMWFAPGIIVIQLSSLLLPLWDVQKNTRRHNANAMRSEGLCVTTSLVSSRSRWIARTRTALDLQISYAPRPLLMYAANKDFTAENVQFVVQVRQFKRAFIEAESKAIERNMRMDHAQLVKLFLQGGQIFFGLVKPDTAVYPININHGTLKALQAVFAPLHCYKDRSSSPSSTIAPWEEPPIEAARPELSTPRPSLLDRLLRRQPAPTVVQHPLESVYAPTDSSSRVSSVSQKSWLEDMAVEFKDADLEIVPDCFNGLVFDEAEKHIRDLIWKNTFQGFVETTEPSKLAIYSRFAPIAVSDPGFKPRFAAYRQIPPSSSSTVHQYSELSSVRSTESFNSMVSAVSAVHQV